ncbi:hypothetical protein GHT06_011991 [Daphnia sinensis]|uniref:Uncharacterized protein n=1 Tax=Daphnia sinensis TaxID=1820382 RepID=A0AAD5LFJ2_9CRUS|nr:hypothetical protein GHT06_011991 [Daphnia sinensis]
MAAEDAIAEVKFQLAEEKNHLLDSKRSLNFRRTSAPKRRICYHFTPETTGGHRSNQLENVKIGKAEGTHRSCATSDVHCHRKKITSPASWEGESETTKFATTMQIKSILADYRARKAG